MSKELADVLAAVHWAIGYLGAMARSNGIYVSDLEAVIARLEEAAKAVQS